MKVGVGWLSPSCCVWWSFRPIDFDMPCRFHTLFGFIALVALLYLTLFVMHPGCFEGLSSGYIGGSRGDAAIYVYLERVNATNFFSWPSEGFDLPVFYPYKRALAYSDNFLLPALIAKILLLFISSEQFVYNLIILGALELNGYCMYCLALHLTASRGASLFASFVFLNCPYFAFHRGHPQLQFGFWIPLTLLATLRFVETRSIARASAIGASITGAFFCAVYYAMYCYLLAGVALCVLFISRPASWRMRDIALLCAGNAAWLLLLLPAMGPYLEVRTSMGTNPMAILRMHSPTLSAFIAAPAIEDLWSPFTKHLSRMEGYLFFGFVTLGLALLMAVQHLASICNGPPLVRKVVYGMIAALIIGALRGAYFSLHSGSRTLHHLAWVQSETVWILLIGLLVVIGMQGYSKRSTSLDRNDLVSLLLFLALFFIFATLGIHDGGDIKRPAPELYRLLIGLPGFNALRGLARMGIVVVMLATLLAACAIARLKTVSLFASHRRYSILCASLIGLSAMELHTHQVPPAPENPAPKIYSAVRSIPEDAAVVALPMGSANRDGRSSMIWNSLYSLWMKDYKNPLVNGFSGKVPPFQALSGHQLDFFPTPESLSLLGTLVGVRYVITNHRHYGEGKARRIRTAAAALPDQIELLTCDAKHSCLFEVSPIINTAMLPATDLLIPWARGDRTVSFEVRGSGAPSEKPLEVKLSFFSRGHLVRPPELLSVTPGADWRFTVSAIPEVAERVTPLVLKVESEDKAPLQIRNIRILTQASQTSTATTQVQ